MKMEDGRWEMGDSGKTAGNISSHTPITGFENLTVWSMAIDLAVEIYKLVRVFPNDERFALTSQIKRSATSVSANITEGFGRKSSKEKINFYNIAYGSLLETKNHLYLSVRLGFLKEDDLKEVFVLITSCQKLLKAFIRSTRSRL